MSNKSMTTAIKNLPGDMVTARMIVLAVREGNLDLIEHLPPKYIKPKTIEKIIKHNQSSYKSFELKSLRPECRTQFICDFAVARDIENIMYVPADKVKCEMITDVMASIDEKLHLLDYIPDNLWTGEAVYKGIKSLYTVSSSQYSSWALLKRKDIKEHISINEDFKLVQILLSMVPQDIKGKAFYNGLFTHTNLSVPDIDFLTPAKYKSLNYYLIMHRRAIDMVPAEKYTYDGFMEAIKSGRLKANDVFNKDSQFKSYIFTIIDDNMADLLAELHPGDFNSLPERFQTSQRLLLSVKANPGYDNFYKLVPEPEEGEKPEDIHARNRSLLTKAICKLLVKTNRRLPLLPKNIWDESFVKYCRKNTDRWYWFWQMPQEFQTQELVNEALQKDEDFIEYVHRSFINSYLAMDIYRRGKRLRKYLPEEYFTQFVEDTGLPVEFFGGESSFLNLKENRLGYTYCRCGNAFIGLYRNGDYKSSATRIILTRINPNGERPDMIFERVVNAFHKTWLEKMIADYDSEFIQPSVTKALKPYRQCNYYGVAEDGKSGDIQIYRNTFRGDTIGFSTILSGELYFTEDRESLIEYIKNKNK